MQPAELLDIYPTLNELGGLTPRDDLEGVSLMPQLKNAATERQRPAITSHNQGNHAVRSERWRYIRYADGTEELYDTLNDPNEWTNLVAPNTSLTTELESVIDSHRLWLPRVDLPPATNSSSRVLTYDAATDEAVWEGKTIRRSDEIPE